MSQSLQPLHRPGFRRLFPFVMLLLLFTGSLLGGCAQEKPVPPDLKQGMTVVREFARPAQLRRTSFYHVFPEGTAQQFVSYYFSTYGSAYWPPREGSAMSHAPEDYASVGITLIPESVRYVPMAPDLQPGNQIVLRPDPETDDVLVEAYSEPGQEPVATERITLPDAAGG